MARTLAEIKQEITTSFMNNEVIASVYGFTTGSLFGNEFSRTSLENMIFDVVAYSNYLLELLFDNHKKEVNDIIESKFPHRSSWYRAKARAFQYGHALIEDSDKYDNNGYTTQEIEDSKIIKYSAVTQSGGQLLIKIASESEGILTPITEMQKQSFDAYIKEIADCGVRYIVINMLPDLLHLNLQIFRDPLIIDENGMSILNGNYPVKDAIKDYMKELPFNGELVLAHLVDKLQKVDGVKIPNIINATSQINITGTTDYLEAQPIMVKTVPESGYFKINDFDNVSYVV